jgi:glycerate 2-kinase
MDANRFVTQSLCEPRITRILAAAIDAVEPGKLVREHLQHADVPKYDRIFLLGIGKASEAMTRAAAEFFNNFTDALVITKLALSKVEGHASPSTRKRITVMESGHPVPDERSLAAGQAALDFISNPKENDLLVCLISGGGSALVTAPRNGITFADIQSQTSNLLASGATIHEINTLRRQMDRIKGGGLARATKAQVFSLILSDVIGNSLETIASGLTVDPSLGTRVQNFIIGDIHVAAQAALEQAINEGFDSEILDLQIKGEAREVGLHFAKRLKEEQSKRQHPFCLIAGGETTVTIKGNGKGGRDQELALAAVDELSDIENILWISLATDGDDGPTDAAGAAVNGETRQRAERLGMSASDYLSRNDAYSFFDPLNDLIKCGYTETNVNDLVFLFAF